jgi:hypothetical protein
MSTIHAKFEVSRSNGSLATAPQTDGSDNLISPIGWAKKQEKGQLRFIYRATMPGNIKMGLTVLLLFSPAFGLI